MALDGGGSGGGPIGSSNSFTGASQSLDLVGDHIFGYSGAVAVGNTEVVLLEFTTGNYYSVCQWFGNYNQAIDQALPTEDFRFILHLNESRIAAQEVSDAQGSSFAFPGQNIIIPSYTILKVTCRNYSGAGTEDMGIVIAGRIYRH